MPLLDLPSRHFTKKVLAQTPVIAIERAAGARGDRLSSLANDVLVAEDFLYVLAVMCSPSNAEESYTRVRKALATAEILEHVRGFKDAGGNVVVDADVALADREDWKKIISDMVAEEAIAHLATGYILRWVLSSWWIPGRQAEASLSCAFGVVDKWAKTKRIVGAGRENLKRHIWLEFRCVSHLWASYYVAQDLGIDISTADGFVRFLSSAQGLLEAGARLVPKGRKAGDTFLSADGAWRIPESHVRRAAQEKGIGHVQIDWIGDPLSHDLRARQPV